jgi:hypothetical protein
MKVMANLKDGDALLHDEKVVGTVHRGASEIYVMPIKGVSEEDMLAALKLLFDRINAELKGGLQ